MCFLGILSMLTHKTIFMCMPQQHVVTINNSFRQLFVKKTSSVDNHTHHVNAQRAGKECNATMHMHAGSQLSCCCWQQLQTTWVFIIYFVHSLLINLFFGSLLCYSKWIGELLLHQVCTDQLAKCFAVHTSLIVIDWFSSLNCSCVCGYFASYSCLGYHRTCLTTEYAW